MKTLRMSQEKKKEEDFRDFHDFHLSSFNDLNDEDHSNDVDVDQFVDFQAMDLETKYRSISCLPPTNPLEFNLMTRSLPPAGKEPSLSVFRQDQASAETLSTGRDQSKATVTAPKIEVTPSSGSRSSSSGSGKSSRPIGVPPEPFYVAPSTHFVTMVNVGDVKARVEVELNSQAGVSYEFFPSKCRWEGVFLDGSTRCKFEINVYKRSRGGFIVEGNRVSGDSFAFVNIYKAIRNIFDSSADTTCVPPLSVPPAGKVSDTDAVRSAVVAVVAMADSLGEAQVGAAQILCDLASDPSLHSTLVELGCVPALIKLMRVEFQSCNQHAICALAQLSSNEQCQAILMRDEAFLQSLLPLCADGSYNTIEMRRECARLLANISCSGQEFARQVVTNAGAEQIQSWLESVDGLKDERLRLHADRAKMSLSSCT